MKTPMTKLMLAAFAALSICLGARAETTLDDGLVAYYKFDGDTTDSSGNGCHLYSTSVNWTTDSFGNADAAILLDGTMDCNLVANPYFGATNTLTIAMWAKPSGTLPTGAYEASSGTSAGFMYQNSATTIALNPSHGMYTDCVGVGILLGVNGIAVLNHRVDNIYSPLVHYEDFGENWIHVVIRIADNTPELYINGTYVKTGQQPSYTQFVGPAGDTNCQSSMGHLYHGALDDVRFYNRALDADEIELLAKPWDGEGDGTEASPYVVTSKDDFETVLKFGSELFVQLEAGLMLAGPITVPEEVSALTLDLNGGSITGATGLAAIILAGDTAFIAKGTGSLSADDGIESVRRLGSVTIGSGVTATGLSGGGSAPAPTFAAGGKAATTEFVQGEGGKWTLTTFAELSNDAVGADVAAEQIKVYSADSVEELESASPMTEGVTVKEKKSAVKTTIEVTPPDPTATQQFFKVEFGE